ncbi:hypothetical protein [Nonomuraea gerenzanensis]|uniref:Uncharacterized protein n=1 Tax=Nonomuraea gerenzanensis TaxID=93944 RepID=A0A1M4ED84_9ACTN|nr:hypothetical protein [Nonomuraea gerenzanensis]UBU08426.1 hypothetical protein LCN96_28960 [Nonomuraea gerenzanensis]SBO96770.1 hypothetical protein BN4615_P6286 [Nonomuraea gerenzanensis]
MTLELRAVVEPSALERLRSGSIVGPIWLDRGEDGFPEAGWTDFPVVILGWWLSALRRPFRTAELTFMDGPWEARLHLRGSAYRAVLRRTYPVVVEGEGEVAFDVLRESVVAAARHVLAECEKRNWTDTDISLLGSIIDLQCKGGRW